MAEFEAVADAVTGAVVGRAVEPKAGEGDGHSHEADCLNCGTLLTGPFCSHCGQHAHVHRTLSAFFHDFAHGVLKTLRRDAPRVFDSLRYVFDEASADSRARAAALLAPFAARVEFRRLADFAGREDPGARRNHRR